MSTSSRTIPSHSQPLLPKLMHTAQTPHLGLWIHLTLSFLLERKELDIKFPFKLAVPGKCTFSIRELTCYTNTFPILYFSLASSLAGCSGGTQYIHHALTIPPSPTLTSSAVPRSQSLSLQKHSLSSNFYTSRIVLLPTWPVTASLNHTFLITEC